MKSDNFVVIQGWFCNELNLKGNELLVFALIYGFCQDGQSVFSGGRKYIADTFNISMKTVDNTLQSLIEQELIVKHSSNDFIHPDIYTIFGDKETLVGREKITPGVAKNFPQGSEKITPNNIDKNIVKKDSNFTNVKLEQATPTPKPLIQTETSNDIATTTPNISNKKKKNRWEQCVEEIEKFTDNEELRSVLTTYLKMRLEMTPIFRGQWLGLLNNLKKLSGDTATQIEIVQQSINRGYKGFFEVKQYKKYGGQDKSVFSEYGQVKSVHKNEEIVNVQF